MQLTVKGKHLDVGDSLREHVRSNLAHTAGKYFRNPIDATVIFTKEKGHRYRADISVHLGGGVVLQAQHEADDPYPAFDVASQRVATRLARYKDRLRDHHRWEDPVDMHAASYTTFRANENETAPNAEPITIAEMETRLPTLAVSDAVMRLELGDLPVLLFKNPKGGLNLVYRRKDGNIGWIDPQIGPQTGGETAPKKAAAQKPAPKKAPAKKAVKKALARPKARKAAPAKKRAGKKK